MKLYPNIFFSTRKRRAKQKQKKKNGTKLVSRMVCLPFARSLVHSRLGDKRPILLPGPVEVGGYRGSPHLRNFHYPGSHYSDFWLMYAKVGDFCVILFFKSQNLHKAETLCKIFGWPKFSFYEHFQPFFRQLHEYLPQN